MSFIEFFNAINKISYDYQDEFFIFVFLPTIFLFIFGLWGIYMVLDNKKRGKRE